MTVSPRFDQYKDAWDTGVTVQVYDINFEKKFVPFLPGSSIPPSFYHSTYLNYWIPSGV